MVIGGFFLALLLTVHAVLVGEGGVDGDDPMITRTRRLIPELLPDRQPPRCIAKPEVAELMGIALWAPSSFLIGRRRLWRLKDILRWINAKAKGAA